jgi:hypothetical protein
MPLSPSNWAETALSSAGLACSCQSGGSGALEHAESSAATAIETRRAFI